MERAIEFSKVVHHHVDWVRGPAKTDENDEELAELAAEKLETEVLDLMLAACRLVTTASTKEEPAEAVRIMNTTDRQNHTRLPARLADFVGRTLNQRMRSNARQASRGGNHKTGQAACRLGIRQRA